MRHAVALQGIQLPDFTCTAALACAFEYRAGHAGFNQARTDGIDANAGARELVCHRLHHTDNAGFAGAVGNAARTGAQARHRCRADDRTALLLGHLHRCILGQKKRADQIDLEYFSPALNGFLKEGHEAAADAGIRIAHIEAAEFFERCGHRAGDILLRGGILDQGNGAASGRANRSHGGLDFRGTIQRHHRGPFGGEQHGAGPPDAAGRAGYDRGLAL